MILLNRFLTVYLRKQLAHVYRQFINDWILWVIILITIFLLLAISVSAWSPDAISKIAFILRRYLYQTYEKSHFGGINDTAQLDSAVFITADDTTAPPIAACGTENCSIWAELVSWFEIFVSEDEPRKPEPAESRTGGAGLYNIGNTSQTF